MAVNSILAARWRHGLGWVFGSVPATAGVGWTAFAICGSAALLSTAGAVLQMIHPAPCTPGLTGWVGDAGMEWAVPVWGAWAVGQVGYYVYRWWCRRLSRGLGLKVAYLMPEAPSLVARLYRRKGIPATARQIAFTIHVNTGWRAPKGMPPDQARALFGELYRADYDRVLAALRGTPALVASSTFNRHDSPAAVRAMDEGWAWQAPGPLLPAQPRLNGPVTRARDQRCMFGAVLSDRRVDHADAWRSRLFDCAAAPA